MKKEEILNASRKEHQNKDLAEMEMIYRAGSHASRVGVIYFSILATQWLVRFIKMKRRSDLLLTIMFFILSVLAFVGFVRQILEVSI